MNNGAPPKVYVVDDDASFRRAMSAVLAKAGYEVEAYENGVGLLNAVDHSANACVVLDLNLPGEDGIQIHQRLIDSGMALPVVFLTGFGTVDTAVTAMKGGAATFLSKPVDPDHLLLVIQEALVQGQSQLKMANELKDVESRISKLTPRENEVVNLIVQGKRTKQIAEDLFISIKTVETHRDNIMKKLGAANVAEVVRIVTTRNMLVTK